MSTSSSVSAQVEAYLPLTQTELSNRFPLRYHGRVEKQERIIQMAGALSSSAIQLSMTEDLIVTGQDNQNMPWSFQIRGDGGLYPFDMYTADLDLNGSEDLLLLLPTGGNGLAPSSHLLTLLFDRSGRPVPFEADGYWEYDEQGIAGLLDLDRNGRAELLYMHFGYGYWVTNLYTADTARWQRIAGTFATRDYPLFTRFTNEPNRQAVPLPTEKQPFSPYLSNSSPQLHGRLVSYQWADVMLSEDILLTIDTPDGDTIECAPVSWHASFAVVIDTEQQRKMVSLSADEATVKSFLDEIVAQHYEVAVYGQRLADRCSPELLWAQSASSIPQK